MPTRDEGSLLRSAFAPPPPGCLRKAKAATKASQQRMTKTKTAVGRGCRTILMFRSVGRTARARGRVASVRGRVQAGAALLARGGGALLDLPPARAHQRAVGEQ